MSSGMDSSILDTYLYEEKENADKIIRDRISDHFWRKP